VGVEVFCSWALGIFPFGFSWVFFFFLGCFLGVLLGLFVFPSS
jgi:hypothetical protein